MRYAVHGLELQSDLPLPPLAAAGSDASSTATAQIGAGPVPEALENAEVTRTHYQSAPGAALLRAPGVGRIYVSGGSAITYELASRQSAANMAAHILGSGCAILHQQRGNVVLHGASVCRDGRAFLVCGPSGAGKSTIAAHLLETGGQTLGDDVVHIGDAPGFLAFPGPASTKLAADALAGLPSYAGREKLGTCPSGKAILATAENFLRVPQKLAGIIVLEWAFAHEEVAATRLPHGEALAALRDNTFRKRCITSDIAQKLFSKWSAIADRVPVWRITRPEGRDTRDEIVKIASELIAQMQNRPERAEGSPEPVDGVKM